MNLVHAARQLLIITPALACIPAFWAALVLLVRPLRDGILDRPRLVAAVVALGYGGYLAICIVNEDFGLIDRSWITPILAVAGVAALFAAITDRRYHTHVQMLLFLREAGQARRAIAALAIGVAAIAIGSALSAVHLQTCGALDRAIRLSGCSSVVSLPNKSGLPRLALSSGAQSAVVGYTIYNEPLQIMRISLDGSWPQQTMHPPAYDTEQYLNTIVTSLGMGVGRVAAITFEGSCYVWDAESGALLRSIAPTSEALKIQSVALAPDGDMLAISRGDGAVVLLSDHPPSELVIVRGMDNAQLAFSSDGARLAISGADQTLIWDVATGATIERLVASGKPIWSPDGASLLVIGPWHALLAEIGGGEPLIREIHGTARGAFTAEGEALIAELVWSNRLRQSALTVRELRSDTIVLSAITSDHVIWQFDGASRTIVLYSNDYATSSSALRIYQIPAAAHAP